MDKKTSLKMIEELSNAYGASGFEDEVLLVGRKYGEGLARIEENSIRDLFFYRNENTGDKPVILLDGHSDEVGFMVQAIKPNGTLQFIPLGGWVENTVPAHKVKVRNAEGKYISGIVASKPPHFMSSAEKGQNLPISAMVIDVGATSKEEVINDFKIRVGAPVVPDVTMEYNEKNDVMLGKAYDCRLGCACVIETLKELQGEQLDVDVVGVFSTQEEVGTRGPVARPCFQIVKTESHHSCLPAAWLGIKQIGTAEVLRAAVDKKCFVERKLRKTFRKERTGFFDFRRIFFGNIFTPLAYALPDQRQVAAGAGSSG